MDASGTGRLNRSSPSCLNRSAQRIDFFHGLIDEARRLPQIRHHEPRVVPRLAVPEANDFGLDHDPALVWLNLVESWFSKLTQQRLRRGVFCSVQELVAAIKGYLTHHNADPKPFVWSTTVETILGKIRKCKAILETYH